MSNQYSVADVAKHKDESNGMWIIVDNGVYDITNFLDEHPGGPKILKRMAGKDSSKQFWKYHNEKVLEKYGGKLKVGTVKEQAKLVEVDAVAFWIRGASAPRRFGFGLAVHSIGDYFDLEATLYICTSFIHRTVHSSRHVTVVLLIYQERRLATNLYPPGGKPLLDLDVHFGRKSYMTYWFEDGTEHGQCIRVFDVPGTLSGNILRLYHNLPDLSGHFEIDGDDIRPLSSCLEPPEPTEDDSKAMGESVSKLTLISVDPENHFVKKGKYRSEIENLIKCQGGFVPGQPLSPNIIQLLGRSADGQLVFEKLSSSAHTLGRFSSLAVYKSWLLQLVNAVECLHSLGIVHRDLRAGNLLFSGDGSRLVVCDLESRWGERKAPEVAFQGGLEDSGWSPKSDIFDMGNCIKSMVYANGPITPFIEWPVPSPLQAIVEACMRPMPEERPTLTDLREMVGKVQA
ncbi:hypothetical protein DHEL01_v207744 [Diaporthe helianthi]|uniref:EKC/KEOPS complex subunit BUD32 n=1 Tax=Diaporthe helianthi TaxID=158607 RepID=A0A2P5HUC1_DIAHE|nr:hypothetical protein DHEL01_v207744 [Diaporthe helianthi]